MDLPWKRGGQRRRKFFLVALAQPLSLRAQQPVSGGCADAEHILKKVNRAADTRRGPAAHAWGTRVWAAVQAGDPNGDEEILA